MDTLLQNDLFAAIVWVAAVTVSVVMAITWMVYLIKIVMNDEEIQEKIRRHKRISEEIMRAEQSKGRGF